MDEADLILKSVNQCGALSSEWSDEGCVRWLSVRFDLTLQTEVTVQNREAIKVVENNEVLLALSLITLELQKAALLVHFLLHIEVIIQI